MFFEVYHQFLLLFAHLLKLIIFLFDLSLQDSSFSFHLFIDLFHFLLELYFYCSGLAVHGFVHFCPYVFGNLIDLMLMIHAEMDKFFGKSAFEDRLVIIQDCFASLEVVDDRKVLFS